MEDVTFAFAARSDVGLVRTNNQDSGYAGPRLLVLADGMGGPAGGDIASSVAVATLAPLDSDTIPADEMLIRLRTALQEAHDELVARSKTDPSLKGLGTTCIALLRSANKLAMVHIGDSRAYLLRDGKLAQVTTDHSLVQYLVDTGQITPEEAEQHPKRSVILRVLGDSGGMDVADETLREAVLGDRWLLCSDGLSGVVSADTIAEVLRQTPDLDEAAAELVNLALLAGAPDNVTCVLADVVPSTTAPNTTPEVVGAAATDRLAPSQLGKGAAGRAAAVVSPGKSQLDAADDDGLDSKRSTWKWVASGLTLLLVACLAAVGFFGYRWSQSQYYLLSDGAQITVYQGIPQGIGEYKLSKPLQVAGVKPAELEPIDRQRLLEPVTFASRAELDAYLTELVARAERQAAEEQKRDDSQSGSTAQSGN